LFVVLLLEKRKKKKLLRYLPLLPTYLLLHFLPFYFFVLSFAHCILRSSAHFCSSFACFQEFLATALCFLSVCCCCWGVIASALGSMACGLGKKKVCWGK
jgi:hypothetical protein